MFVENGCVHQHFNDDPDERSDPARVQGQAAVPVHAPALSEDDFLSSDDAAERPRGLDPADRSLRSSTAPEDTNMKVT